MSRYNWVNASEFRENSIRLENSGSFPLNSSRENILEHSLCLINQFERRVQQHRKELELAEKTRNEQQREAKVCGIFCFLVFVFLAVATSARVVCGALPFF